MDPFNQDDHLDTETIVDPNKNYLEEYVGEGKKFKTEADLARGKAESDAFIKRLQNELAGVRDALKERTTMQEFLDQLKNSRQAPDPNNQQEKQDDDSKNPLTPEAVKEQFERLLNERTSQDRKVQNYRQVTETLEQSFGTDAQRVVHEKAQELGMELNTLKTLAEENPKAFLTLVGATGQRQPSEADLFAGPPTSRVNTSGRTNENDGIKTMSYYEKIRKADPHRYWSPSVQNELHKNAMRLGDRFLDT